MQSSPWFLGKDNAVKANPYEMRQLRTKRHLTDRTLHVECPQYDSVDQQTARVIAVMALPDAVIGGCGKINVRGKRWHYEFDTKTLNKDTARRGFNRMGIVQNPLEKVAAGSFYDTTRQLWAVPQNYGVRETIKFPTTEQSQCLEGESNGSEP